MRTKSALLILVVSLVSAHASAQNAVLPATTPESAGSFPKLSWPRPFVYGGVGLGGGGYAPLAGKVGAGLRIDRTHLVWSASAAYDNSHKSNDNTIHNSNGHQRTLDSSIYYRLNNGWFMGGGASWNQLSTTAYTKQVFQPSVGGGKDYLHQDCAAEDCVVRWSMRLQVDYKLKGAEHVDAKGCSVPNGQCPNDVQGPVISFYLPSPALAGHLYWREAVGVYSFHDTVTSTDPTLTALQKSHRSVASFIECTMMYRF